MGLLYDGNLETVEGHTKKGSRLKDVKRSAVYELIKVLRRTKYEQSDLQAMVRSNVFGLFCIQTLQWDVVSTRFHRP